MQNSNGKEGLRGKEKVVDKQIEYGSEEKNSEECHMVHCMQQILGY